MVLMFVTCGLLEERTVTALQILQIEESSERLDRVVEVKVDYFLFFCLVKDYVVM
jgi:hypothetical protein